MRFVRCTLLLASVMAGGCAASVGSPSEDVAAPERQELVGPAADGAEGDGAGASARAEMPRLFVEATPPAAQPDKPPPNPWHFVAPTSFALVSPSGQGGSPAPAPAGGGQGGGGNKPPP